MERRRCRHRRRGVAEMPRLTDQAVLQIVVLYYEPVVVDII